MATATVRVGLDGKSDCALTLRSHRHARLEGRAQFLILHPLALTRVHVQDEAARGLDGPHLDDDTGAGVAELLADGHRSSFPFCDFHGNASMWPMRVFSGRGDISAASCSLASLGSAK